MTTAQRSAAARDVCAQTVVDVPAEGWIAVRQGGKLLFEYHPERELVRVVKRGRPYVVALTGLHRQCPLRRLSSAYRPS